MTQNQLYEVRINRAIEYIHQHLKEDIGVDDLARVSQFSIFHFSRIYKELIGESPYDSILRLRLEKAVFLLKYRPHIKVGDIAFECGFLSAENFSRQFKKRFDLTPREIKRDTTHHNSRIYQEFNSKDFYLRIEDSRKSGLKKFDIQLESLPEMLVAFTRAQFGEDGSEMVSKYQELMAWAEKNQMEYQGPMRRFGMSMDQIEVTPSSKFRYDFALVVDEDFEATGLIQKKVIPAAHYATVLVQGDLSEVAKAWGYLYKAWLPDSQYIPMDYPAVEEFIQGPEEIGWEQFHMKCRIPVEKCEY